jgi:hypothetical protein
MTDLKLTTGYWKMRNGGKVKLVHREEGVRYPWVGYQDGEKDCCFEWRDDGTYLTSVGDYDIIAPWVEPVVLECWVVAWLAAGTLQRDVFCSEAIARRYSEDLASEGCKIHSITKHVAHEGEGL